MQDALRQLEADNHRLQQLLAILEQKIALLEQELFLYKSSQAASTDLSSPPHYLDRKDQPYKFQSNYLGRDDQTRKTPPHYLGRNDQLYKFPPHYLDGNNPTSKFPPHQLEGNDKAITKEQLLQRWLRSSVMRYRGRDVTKDCAALLWRLRENPLISCNEMGKLFGLSTSGVRKRIMRMKHFGLITSIGKQKYQPTPQAMEYMNEILKRTEQKEFS